MTPYECSACVTPVSLSWKPSFRLYFLWPLLFLLGVPGCLTLFRNYHPPVQDGTERTASSWSSLSGLDKVGTGYKKKINMLTAEWRESETHEQRKQVFWLKRSKGADEVPYRITMLIF
ncbi:unnamed protein product [Arctogadus glacialis]